MTELIDLDAVGEELVEVRPVKVGGKIYDFPGVLGAKAIRGFLPLLDQMKTIDDVEEPTAAQLETMLDVVEKIVASLVGPDHADEIMTNADAKKLQLLIERLFEVYGVGEAPASSTSSESGGAKLKPTSNASTAST